MKHTWILFAMAVVWINADLASAEQNNRSPQPYEHLTYFYYPEFSVYHLSGQVLYQGPDMYVNCEFEDKQVGLVSGNGLQPVTRLCSDGMVDVLVRIRVQDATVELHTMIQDKTHEVTFVHTLKRIEGFEVDRRWGVGVE